MLRVTEYFAKSVKVTQDHWEDFVDRIQVTIGVP